MGSNTQSFIDSPFAEKPKNSVVARFDGKLNSQDHQANPEMVFQMARQIMGDNGMRNVINGPTNTSQADAQFVQNNAQRAAVVIPVR